MKKNRVFRDIPRCKSRPRNLGYADKKQNKSMRVMKRPKNRSKIWHDVYEESGFEGIRKGTRPRKREKKEDKEKKKRSFSLRRTKSNPGSNLYRVQSEVERKRNIMKKICYKGTFFLRKIILFIFEK